ncbi:hypothetical protein B0T17DRAFT_273880 [Bombardia bombarda]|uniref:Uncharacterized protein n=1 Tax=Bombardia bombarda TaxID=252184 RepID=A0AA40C552_9PEZI|nr:hypothetical protein B0T17DRAFT_273880 [Bombardia bombarda]
MTTQILPLSLGLNCPKGGQFYTCQNAAIEFIGCCTTDPCANGSGTCPDGDLREASFSSASYATIPTQECNAGTTQTSGSAAQWYTCALDAPPFLGCCKSNPCTNASCPIDDLVPARLSSNPSSRSVFLPIIVTSSPAVSATSVAKPRDTDNSGAIPAGAIIGIAIASAITVLAMFFIILYKCGCRRRRKVQRMPYQPVHSRQLSGMVREAENGLGHGGKRFISPPRGPYIPSPDHKRQISGSEPLIRQIYSPALSSPPASNVGSPLFHPYSNLIGSPIPKATSQPPAELESHGNPISYFIELPANEPASFPSPVAVAVPTSRYARHDSTVLSSWDNANNELHIWATPERKGSWRPTTGHGVRGHRPNPEPIPEKEAEY